MYFPVFNFDFFSNEIFFAFMLGAILLDFPRYTLAAVVTALRSVFVHRIDPDFQPTVSVIISTYNGSDSLLDCLKSLHCQTYQPMEVFVVDDGSSENLNAILSYAKHRHLVQKIIVHRLRCGKSASVNHAARFAKGDLLLNIDDDTHLDKNAILELVSAFKNKNTVIASGLLTIRNSEASLITSLQSIEYALAMNSGRVFLDYFGAMPCCSGAFNMMRKDFFTQTFGLNTGPGEDLEITLRARQLGFDARFVETAHASVLAPEAFFSLIGQRLRWDRDEFNIRVNQYNEFSFIHPLHRLSEYIHSLDFFVFSFLSTLLFPVYMLYLNAALGYLFWDFLFYLYLYLLPFYLIPIVLNFMNPSIRLSFYDILVLPIFPLYQGFFMKLVRLYAYCSEIILRNSIHDDYVPKRIRSALYDNQNLVKP